MPAVHRLRRSLLRRAFSVAPVSFQVYLFPLRDSRYILLIKKSDVAASLFVRRGRSQKVSTARRRPQDQGERLTISLRSSSRCWTKAGAATIGQDGSVTRVELVRRVLAPRLTPVAINSGYQHLPVDADCKPRPMARSMSKTRKAEEKVSDRDEVT